MISPLDLAVILLYLLAVTLFGMKFRQGDRSLKSYFLGSETVPWWAISLSIVAAETSTLTLVSVPGIAYQGDFSFLQLALGYICGRVVISVLLIPQFFRREIFTAYEWIEHRFGKRLQKITAAVFLLTRAAAEGVRVFAVSIVMTIAFNLSDSGTSAAANDAVAIGVVILLTLLYTYHGGLNAVIWTDVLQIGIYTTASFIGLLTLIHLIPSGWDGFFQAGALANKFHIFDFSWGFHQPYTIYAGLIGGTFITTASHGTDQLLVQRLLATRSEHKAKLALISSGFLVFVQFAFYLTIGAALFVLDQSSPKTGAAATAPVRSDHIFPEFIVHHMPEGIRGLLIAAILAAAMSNLSAALNSLASTSVMDFYRNWFPKSDEKKLVQLSHRTTIGWAFVLFGLAMLSRHGGRVVETGLAIASVTYGGLLGVFLVGRLSQKVSETSAIVGMVAGLLLNLGVWMGTSIAFPWYVPLGSLTTLAVAWIFEFVSR